MSKPIGKFPTLPFSAQEKFSSLSFLRTSILVNKNKKEIISTWIYTDRFYQNYKQLDAKIYYVPPRFLQKEIFLMRVCDLSIAKTMDVYKFDAFQLSFEPIHQMNKTGFNALSVAANSTPTKEMLAEVERRLVFVGTYAYEELDFTKIKKMK